MPAHDCIVAIAPSFATSSLFPQLLACCAAARACLTERTFYRKFLAATGETPARFVEWLGLTQPGYSFHVGYR